MRNWIALVLALGLAMAAGAAPGESTYEVRGVVQELPKENPKAVVVDHEEIPGYMAAMVMTLEARETREVAPLKPGDRIHFRLNVTKDEHWIDQVKVLAAGTPRAGGKDLLVPIEAGAQLPDATLVDHQGRPIDFRTFRGHPLVVTFFYRTCPLPDFCPLLHRKFQETQALLKQDAAAPADWRLLSITIDPERDTPDALAALASSLGADPDRWIFATGTLKNITTFTLRGGLQFWEERGIIQHNMRTLVIDPAGVVRRILSDNRWTAAELVTEIKHAATESIPR